MRIVAYVKRGSCLISVTRMWSLLALRPKPLGRSIVPQCHRRIATAEVTPRSKLRPAFRCSGEVGTNGLHWRWPAVRAFGDALRKPCFQRA